MLTDHLAGPDGGAAASGPLEELGERSATVAYHARLSLGCC
jgi:hypothetical protein